MKKKRIPYSGESYYEIMRRDKLSSERHQKTASSRRLSVLHAVVGDYPPEIWCRIARETGFKSCESFKKQVTKVKRRLFVEERAKKRGKFPEQEPWDWSGKKC